MKYTGAGRDIPAPNEYQPDVDYMGKEVKGGADFGKSHSVR